MQWPYSLTGEAKVTPNYKYCVNTFQVHVTWAWPLFVNATVGPPATCEHVEFSFRETRPNTCGIVDGMYARPFMAFIILS